MGKKVEKEKNEIVNWTQKIRHFLIKWEYILKSYKNYNYTM